MESILSGPYASLGRGSCRSGVALLAVAGKQREQHLNRNKAIEARAFALVPHSIPFLPSKRAIYQLARRCKARGTMLS